MKCQINKNGNALGKTEAGRMISIMLFFNHMGAPFVAVLIRKWGHTVVASIGQQISKPRKKLFEIFTILLKRVMLNEIYGITPPI